MRFQPEARSTVVGLGGEPVTVSTATLLADPQHRPLTVQQSGKALTVTLPADIWDDRCTVLKLAIAPTK